MNARYFYKNTIAAFLRQNEDEIFGMLSMNDEYDTMATQKFAWLDEIRLLKSALLPYANEEGWVVFEYTIPRLGKRIDVVVLLRERVFILEFKAGEVTFNRQDVDQVMDYALDLKNFHQGSANRTIVPILVATESPSYSTTVMTSHYDDGVYEPLMTNAEGLSRVFELALQQEVETHQEAVSLDDWVKSRYAPTPTIIEAASALYSRHSVEEITRHEAEGEQLDRTTDYVLKVIHDTKARGGKSICFVTGVPGAGKTLVGLNVAIKQSDHEAGENPDLAVYLSGNGPLVQVLTEALARDKKRQKNEQGEKYNITDARREVSQFIQIIHRYRDNMLQKLRTPVRDGIIEIDPEKELKDKRAGYAEVENIAIFDEAQRSWDKEHLASWLKRKKGINDFPMSEGEFLIWSLDQRKDWAVIVCLVGGGQEINTGEAGISEWVRAMNETFPDWQVYISSQLTAKEYAEGKVEELLCDNPNVIYSDDAIRSMWACLTGRGGSFFEVHTVLFHGIGTFTFFLFVFQGLVEFHTKKDVKLVIITYALYCLIVGPFAQLIDTNFNNFVRSNAPFLEDIRLRIRGSIGAFLGQTVYVLILSVGTILVPLLAYFVLKWMTALFHHRKAGDVNQGTVL